MIALRHSVPHMRLPRTGVALAATAVLTWVTSGEAQHERNPLATRKAALPIPRARCISYHGASHPKARRDLRTIDNALQQDGAGTALAAVSPENRLVDNLARARKMPPGGQKLSAAQAARIVVRMPSGSKGTTTESVHWSFHPPVRPTLPAVEGSRVANPIDAFLLRDLRKRGLSFSPPADRRTLLRRITFDLIGLPPTPAEVDAFLADRRPDAYERVVDRLLADPRYGERWARYWLDTAGYADSEGVLEEDRIRPNSWRYRDYVIRSLNADMPYDRFLREQIAGDELADYRNAKIWTQEIEEQVTATGFLRTAVDATRDDFNDHQFTEYQYRMLNDTETILVSTTLGLTLQCARCHDHKFEPLSQRDYYRVQAILEGAIRPRGKLIPTNRRQIVAGTAEDQKHASDVNAKVTVAVGELDKQDAALILEYRLKALEAKAGTVPEGERAALLEAARTEAGKRTEAQKALAAKHKALLESSVESLSTQYPELKQKHGEITAAKAAEEKKRIALPEIRALYDQDCSPPPTHVLIRGELTRPGDAVEPGIPAVIDNRQKPFTIPAPSAGATTTGRRSALAAWITRPDNPLTARVLVNRLWAHHFGVGIVPTVENFGISGTPPTNQPLLDWLAASFVSKGGGANDSAWSLKRLHRLIVTSAAYRQGSAYRVEGARVDPEDRLLWRQRSRRLEAEAIRDSMLAVTGTLDRTMYGEPVGESELKTGEIVAEGEVKGGRRSIYLLVRRSRPVTMLNTFDAPIMETNCTRRITSTTATQALTMMNGGFMESQAGHFADRLLKDGGTTDSRVMLAYRLAFGRAASAAEMRSATAFLQGQTARYSGAGKKRDEAERAAVADFCQAILSANEFLYVD
jgi:hypothetical protein